MLFLLSLVGFLDVLYGATVNFATSGGAGGRGFLLALSSVFPCLLLLGVFNHYMSRALGGGIVLEIVLDVLSLMALFFNIDYANLQFLEF